jgi:hypothetical protein
MNPPFLLQLASLPAVVSRLHCQLLAAAGKLLVASFIAVLIPLLRLESASYFTLI